MSVPRIALSEIARGLGWRRGRWIEMLWTYLDESGEHFPESHPFRGQLSRLTVGGGIARLEEWEALSLRWAAVLDRYQIPAFHMTDFEARQTPFDWCDTKRRDLLGELLDIAVSTVREFIGFVGQPEAGKTTLVDAYETCVAKISREISIDIANLEEPVTVIFARHKEFSAARIGRYFDLWNDDGKLVFGGVANPEQVCPLQVADIVAYEVARYSRTERPERDRYPFARLSAKMRPITFRLTANSRVSVSDA